jgi:hypothetical protein
MPLPLSRRFLAHVACLAFPCCSLLCCLLQLGINYFSEVEAPKGLASSSGDNQDEKVR